MRHSGSHWFPVIASQTLMYNLFRRRISQVEREVAHIFSKTPLGNVREDGSADAAKPSSLNRMPRTCMVDGKSHLLQIVL